MTKDLALLVGADQRWLSTTGFLDKVAENLEEGDGGISRTQFAAALGIHDGTRLRQICHADPLSRYAVARVQSLAVAARS